MTCIAFTIEGNPVPKERPRVFGRRTITPKRTAAYEALVKHACIDAAKSWKRAMGAAWPLDARYSVTLLVVRDSKRSADLDNFAKSILDGAKGALWLDDAQVDELSVCRGAVDKAHPRVVMMVRVMEASELRAIESAIEAGARSAA